MTDPSTQHSTVTERNACENELRQAFDQSAHMPDQSTLENMQRFAATLPERSLKPKHGWYSRERGGRRTWLSGWSLAALSGVSLAAAAALFMVWALPASDTTHPEVAQGNTPVQEANTSQTRNAEQGFGNAEQGLGNTEEELVADASVESSDPAEEDQLGFGDPLSMEDEYEEEPMLIAAIYDSYLSEL